MDRSDLSGRSHLKAIYDSRILVDEEEPISPTLGIFLSGCNLRCKFCHVAEFSWCQKGLLDAKQLASYLSLVTELSELRLINVRTISFIGGEPSLYLAEIYRARQEMLEASSSLGGENHRLLPLVLNSNLLIPESEISLCIKVFDYIIADIKFGNEQCASQLTRAPIEGALRYWERVTSNVLALSKFSKVILRHLVLPGHVECCTVPVLRWVHSFVPEIPVNLMLNYYPSTSTDVSSLDRRLTDKEKKMAMEAARRLGIKLVATHLTQNQEGVRTTKTPDLAPTAAGLERLLSNACLGSSRKPYDVIIAQDGSVIIPDLPEELVGLVDRLDLASCDFRDGVRPTRPARATVSNR